MNKKELLDRKAWHLDNLPYEIMWLNREGKIEFMNEALCDKLGYTLEEAQKLTVYDVNPRTTIEIWEKHWQEVEQNKTVNFKTLHKKKNGVLYDAEVFTQYFSNNGKNLLCAIVSEITKSTFYKHVLDRSEELVCMGGWKLNLQDDSIIATEQLLQIFEIESFDEVRPINLIRYFTDPEKFQQMISKALVEGQNYDEILEIKDQKGNSKWLHCVGEPIYIKDKITKVIGVYQDITDSQNNMRSLELYKNIINQSEDMVTVWDKQGKLLDYNQSVLDKLGFSKEKLDEAYIFDLNDDIDEKWWENHFNDLISRKNFRLEWKALKVDGSQFPVDISVNHVVSNGEHLNCAILRDISERKRNESDLKRAYQEIQDLSNQLEKENEYLQEEVRNLGKFENIICKSKAYSAVLKQVEQVAPTETTVLITGESGTGKELLANALHQNSKRKGHVMVRVNCASIPKELIESELFGHKKGSFTGAIADKEGKFSVADKGTLFLDEIGELPFDMQAKLLRVLQEGEFDIVGGLTKKVDVRILAATNRNLENMVANGTFREDLFYRLNVFPIRNIPLRERKEDIPLLAQFFLEKYAPKAGKQFKHISKKTMDALLDYNFPGNIRELENLIERAVIIESGTTLYPGSWLPSNKEIINKDDSLVSFDEMQRNYILQVLGKTKGKVSGPGGAAEILKIKDKTLFARMKKLGIEKKMVSSRKK